MLLSRHSNAELRVLFEQATRTQTQEQIDRQFGKPPYPFLGGRSGPAPRYADFVVQYRDQHGLQYQYIEDNTLLAVRIPIALRRAHTVEWPWPGSTVVLQSVTSDDSFPIRVVSLQKNSTRSSTAYIEFNRDV
jgi:hypothetical protein